MIESFIGALAAVIFVEIAYIGKDYIEYRLEINQHKKYCKEHDIPYIKPADATKALENFMNRPIEEYIEALQDEEEGRASLRICPKCLEYKRNFMVEGVNRECMDCAIGGISDN